MQTGGVASFGGYKTMKLSDKELRAIRALAAGRAFDATAWMSDAEIVATLARIPDSHKRRIMRSLKKP